MIVELVATVALLGSGYAVYRDRAKLEAEVKAEVAKLLPEIKAEIAKVVAEVKTKI